MIAFTNEASTVNLVQNGWIMAHQLHQKRQVVHHIHHDIQRMLDRRETGFAGEIIIRHLLLEQMRCVVGADGINQAVMQSLEQGFLVAVRLDGRVTLDREMSFNGMSFLNNDSSFCVEI